MKRFIILALALVLAFAGTNTLSAIASSRPFSELSEVYLENQGEALQIHATVQEKVAIDKDFASHFGGAWIGEDGRLNVSLTLGAKADKASLGNIEWQSAEYPFEYLKSIKSLLWEQRKDYGIRSILTEVMNNRLVVFLNDMDNKIVESIKQNVDCSAVVFKQSQQGEYTASVVNGTEANVLGVGGYTVGFRAKLGSVKGIVTAGHYNSVGNYVFYNGGTTVNGTIQARSFGGNVDAAFASINAANEGTKTFMNGDYYTGVGFSSGDLVANMSVAMYGMKSGLETGKIIDPAYEYEDEFGEWVVVAASYSCQHGDSGAAIVFPKYVGSASTSPYVMGVQSGIQEGMSTFTRVDYIIDELGITPY